MSGTNVSVKVQQVRPPKQSEWLYRILDVLHGAGFEMLSCIPVELELHVPCHRALYSFAWSLATCSRTILLHGSGQYCYGGKSAMADRKCHVLLADIATCGSESKPACMSWTKFTWIAIERVLGSLLCHGVLQHLLWRFMMRFNS